MSQDPASGRSVGDRLKGYLLRGTLFVIPMLVTVAIVIFVARFFSGFLEPVATLMANETGLSGPLGQIFVLMSFVLVILVLGAIIETIPHGMAAAGFFHSLVESIPGVGSVYSGFREMSETIASGGESFRDVKLVEFPMEGSYSMAFVTADAPTSLEESVGPPTEDMISLFLPMGPNPVMGGFVIYVARDRVYDIDISVEQGLQAIITSGVTMGEGDAANGPSEGP